MVQDPLGEDPGVVGDHVAGQADPAGLGPFVEVLEGGLAAQVVGDAVIVHGIGRGDGVDIAHQVLDPAGGAASLPDADQPEAVEIPAGDLVQFLIRDLVQGPDGAAVLLGELVEPDAAVFGQEDDARHPVRILGEVFRFSIIPSSCPRRSGSRICPESIFPLHRWNHDNGARWSAARPVRRSRVSGPL